MSTPKTSKPRNSKPKDRKSSVQRDEDTDDMFEGTESGPKPADVDVDDTSKWISTGRPQIETKLAIKTIPVRKPPKSTFFRVHPDLTFECTLFYAPQAEGTMDEDVYLLAEDIRDECIADPGLAECMKHQQAYFWIGTNGAMGVWLVNLPTETGALNSWSESAHDLCGDAMQEWVARRPDQPNGVYQKGLPRKPELFAGKDEWPDQIVTAMDIIKRAFRGKMIEDIDHSALLKTVGGA